MKTFKSTVVISVLALTTAVVTIVACNKNNTPLTVQRETETRTRISNLLDKMYVESDASGDEAITAAFQALSAEEFAIYNELRDQRDSIQAAKEAGGTKLELAASFKKSRDFRNIMDQIAVEKYGMHSNKLNIEQLRAIGEKAKVEVRENMTSSARATAAAAACPRFSYLLSAAYTESNGRGRYQWLPADNDPEVIPFCDSEHRFDGFYSRIKGMNYASRQAILWYGTLARRSLYYSDGTDTAVLLGLAGASFWLGTPANLNAQMRYQ